MHVGRGLCHAAVGDSSAKTGAYVWKSLLDSGAVICNGTDAPVEPIDPIACFYASVTRRLADGVTFFPEQCMTRDHTLILYIGLCLRGF